MHCFDLQDRERDTKRREMNRKIEQIIKKQMNRVNKKSKIKIKR